MGIFPKFSGWTSKKIETTTGQPQDVHDLKSQVSTSRSSPKAISSGHAFDISVVSWIKVQKGQKCCPFHAFRFYVIL